MGVKILILHISFHLTDIIHCRFRPRHLLRTIAASYRLKCSRAADQQSATQGSWS